MKENFRKKVISLRKNTSDDYIFEASSIITNKLLNMDILSKASTIMTYLDFNSEVKTDYMIYELLKLEKKILIPITLKDEKRLLASQLKDLDSELKVGTFGIREPKDEFVRICDVEDIDILIVPAVAFDNNKYRLGYGGGFYDRFIESLRDDTYIIGIAFDFQVFENIPKEPHDAQMDIVITELRTIK